MSYSSSFQKSKIGYQWGCFFLRTMRENLIHNSLLASCGLLTIFGIPWPLYFNFCFHRHTVFSLCSCICVQISPLKRTPITLDKRPILLLYNLILTLSAMTLLPNKVMFEVLGFQTSAYKLWDNKIQLITIILTLN